jgi:hypothetical protein
MPIGDYMRTYLALDLLISVALLISACSKMRGSHEPLPAVPADTVAAAPTAESADGEPFHPPTKEEYYHMLRAGYKAPLRTVSGDGYRTTGTAPGTRYPISEAEGYDLKYKFGEGRKAAASGRGEEPEVPSYIEHGEDDDGTYPPREFKGHD